MWFTESALCGWKQSPPQSQPLCQENNQIISLFPINYVPMIVLLILSVWKRLHGAHKKRKSAIECSERAAQYISQEIRLDIFLFMARWFWKAIHAWKLNREERADEEKIGTDRIIKSFLWKIEIMNINNENGKNENAVCGVENLAGLGGSAERDWRNKNL